LTELHTFGPLPMPTGAWSRADLEFYGINHFRPSYVARIFFNDDDVNADNATIDRPSYAGGFAIFGHQRCSGDEGHCEVHVVARRFDVRPSHPLTRAFKRVVVTEGLRRCSADDALRITVVVACHPDELDEESEPLLDFQGLQLSTFAS
jgi:hypothetical protein